MIKKHFNKNFLSFSHIRPCSSTEDSELVLANVRHFETLTAKVIMVLHILSIVTGE